MNLCLPVACRMPGASMVPAASTVCPRACQEALVPGSSANRNQCNIEDFSVQRTCRDRERMWGLFTVRYRWHWIVRSRSQPLNSLNQSQIGESW